MLVLQYDAPEDPPPFPEKLQRPGLKPFVVVPGGMPGVFSSNPSRTVTVWARRVKIDRTPSMPILSTLLVKVFIVAVRCLVVSR